ncbi:MAG TPA: serine/threonine-protein kinase [Acidimicrobiales bacterium]|nr:serine/threonine-protein kinase [Acidimicrobiales bacterium]
MEADAAVAPRVLGARYRLGARLGRGGMAEVYDGFDERLGRSVAVKLLRPEMAADPDVRARFEIEARSAAGLAHPNVVAVYDTGEDDGVPFIVMERLPGETLADRMARGPVDQGWLRRVAGDVLGALGAAHAAGLVHRDVKPGNILIGEDGCAKVADFGIAKSLEVAGEATGTGLLLGTPAYVAPERLEGQPATERSDLYSLGVVLYEALAGSKPFDGPTSVAVTESVLHSVPRPLVEVRPDVDGAFAAAVSRAMSRDPADRPASAPELSSELSVAPAPSGDPTVSLAVAAEDLDATLVGAPGLLQPPPDPPADAVAAVAPPVPGRGAERRRHRPATPLLVGAGVVAALLLLLVLAGSRTGGNPSPSILAADIRELAGRVEDGDGPQGPAAADRLAGVADEVEAGGGADEASALLADVARWRQQGTLSAAAADAIVALLGRIDGVDATEAASSTTTTITTTTAATVPPASGDQGGTRGKKHGKGSD